MVHIIRSHELYKAEYKYIRDTRQQDRPKGITLDLAKRQRTLERVQEEAVLAMQYMQESWVKPTNYKPYQEGDKVWLEATNLHTTHPMKKLCPKHYRPFKVLEAVRTVNSCLELPAH